MKTTMVHVPTLLGCIARGPTTQDAIHNTPEAITSFLSDLRSHDKTVDPFAPFEITIAEHVMEGSWIGYGDPAPGFAVDFEPLSSPDHITYLAHLGYLQADLLNIAKTLPVNKLFESPPNGHRPIYNILSHIAESQTTYLRYLVGPVDGLSAAVKSITPESDVCLNLEHVFELITSRLQSLSSAECKQLVPHGQVTWSARRCFRRTLEHAWEHLCEIRTRAL